MLDEADIVRYSRQILLREVGGQGQERLLQNCVRIVGDGDAVAIATSYLSLGGSPLVFDRDTRIGGFGERVLNCDDLDRCASPIVTLYSADTWARLVETSTTRVVVLTASSVVYSATSTCLRCFNRVVRRSSTPATACSAALGAAAALCVQRQVLGMELASGVILVGDETPLLAHEPISCECR